MAGSLSTPPCLIFIVEKPANLLSGCCAVFSIELRTYKVAYKVDGSMLDNGFCTRQA